MEESEQRKERLKAMRPEAAMGGVGDGVGNSSIVSQSLANPLMEANSPSSIRPESVSAPAPRFDHYTDPLAAFSSNGRSSKVSHQISPDYSTPSVSNCYVFKSRLQEFAQKVGLPTPVYETIKEGPSHEPTFKSAVILNDVRYDSLPGFFNRKAAEQSAAEIALLSLSHSGDTAACISQPVHETGLCKNLLQEYAQKMNHAIPLYECKRDETSGRIPMFSCTVDIGGIKYIGGATRTKKEAEIKAARTALLAIQATSSGSHLDGQSNYTVVPVKKKMPDLGTPAVEPAAALKPKKRHFKKKQPRKRNGANGGNNRQIKSQIKNKTSQIQVHVGDQISTELGDANANANANANADADANANANANSNANACQVTSLIVSPLGTSEDSQQFKNCFMDVAFVPCSNTGDGNGDMSNDVKNLVELSG